MIYEFSGLDREYLAGVFARAQENGQSVKIEARRDGVAVKRGESIWTHTFGTVATPDRITHTTVQHPQVVTWE